MPEVLQYFSLINPLSYMIDISRRVYLEGVGVDRLTFDLWPLALTAVLTLSIGAWVFRRQLG
jgi:ABC-2 type transport system permease protein